MSKLIQGDTVVLKGQRKGRFHLEGGVVIYIEGEAVEIMCDGKTWVMSMDEIEPFTVEYVTPKGNLLVPMAGVSS